MSPNNSNNGSAVNSDNETAREKSGKAGDSSEEPAEQVVSKARRKKRSGR